jgi:hypothetical protein
VESHAQLFQKQQELSAENRKPKHSPIPNSVLLKQGIMYFSHHVFSWAQNFTKN